MNDKDKTYAIDYDSGEKETRVPLGAIRFHSNGKLYVKKNTK